MSEKRYKPCKPYRLSTIGVCLFGRPFFPEGYDLCPRQWYTDQFDGKTDDWLTDTSFERLQSQVEDYLRFVYPRFNSAWISFNWALLLGSFLIGIVPFFLGLFIIYLNGDKSRLAFKEMMKRAFDLEIEARQHDVPPEGREVDIISHHLVCAYFESFQRLSYSLLDPITWFRKFGQLQDVEVFCKKCTGVITDEYELWNGHKELAPAAIQKAVEKLSHPRGGGSMRYIFLFITTLILFVTSVLLSIFLDKNPPYQPEVSLAVGCTVIVIYVSVSLLYLWTWIPVARKIAGLVRPSTERWADEGRISRDAIDAVTDLGMLSILVTELDKERMYLPSMMYWQNVAPALSDEPPESAKHSIRSGLSRTHPGEDIRSLPGSPTQETPAAAGLASIRVSQAASPMPPGYGSATNSPRYNHTVLRAPAYVHSSPEGAFDRAWKDTVVEQPPVGDVFVEANEAVEAVLPEQADGATPEKKVHFETE